MAAALDGPTPGSRARVPAGAVFRFTTPSIVLAARAPPAAAATVRKTTHEQIAGKARTFPFRRRAGRGCGDYCGAQNAVCTQGVAESEKPPPVPVGLQA